MAPNLRDLTTVPSWGYGYMTRTRGPYEVSSWGHNRLESYEYENTDTTSTYWSHHYRYDTSYTGSLVYPSFKVRNDVKKLLKRMADSLCKEGWLNPKPYYIEPKVIPVNLRGVRLQGWGWGNKHI